MDSKPYRITKNYKGIYINEHVRLSFRNYVTVVTCKILVKFSLKTDPKNNQVQTSA